MSLGSLLGLKSSASLADIVQYTSKPVATYTYNANKEVVISAIDTTLDTFTSVAHGLANGDVIYPIANYAVGLIYPINVYAGGLPAINYLGWYVVNKTANTFQLSLTSGGAAIDLTTNANMDLTKWHFEKPGVDIINITNLPPNAKYKLVIKGRNLSNDLNGFVFPNGITYGSDWLSTSGTAYSIGALYLNGNIAIDCVILIDYEGFLCITASGILIKTTSTTANTSSLLNRIVKNMNYKAGLITNIQITNQIFANQSTVEVYKA